jgi:hypothetical protein
VRREFPYDLVGRSRYNDGVVLRENRNPRQPTAVDYNELNLGSEPPAARTLRVRRKAKPAALPLAGI